MTTRSRIERWGVAVDELHASSTAWEMAAQQTESASDGVVRQISNPGGTQWIGAGADAALTAVHKDRATAYHSGEIMRGLATKASTGADDIQSLQRSALDYISTIERDGFIVGEICRSSTTRQQPIPSPPRSGRPSPKNTAAC